MRVRFLFWIKGIWRRWLYRSPRFGGRSALACSYFLAGLQDISQALYDAAKVDGANRWQQFRHITIPGLRGPSPSCAFCR